MDDFRHRLPGRLDKMVDGVITVREPLFGPNGTAGFGMQWVDKNDKPLSYAAKFGSPRISVGCSRARPGQREGAHIL